MELGGLKAKAKSSSSEMDSSDGHSQRVKAEQTRAKDMSVA